MGLDFIHRIIKVFLIVTALFVPFIFLSFGPSFTLGFLSGALWNLLNIRILAVLFCKKGLFLYLVKFPFLYLSGYLILKYTDFSIYGIIMGFSLIFLVIILKVLGKFLIDYKGMEAYERSP